MGAPVIPSGASIRKIASTTHIPVHELSRSGGRSIRVEHILPAPVEVSNSVHRHSYHEIFLFMKGSGTHMIDLEHHEMKAPCIHLVGPGQVHKLERSGDCEGLVILFEPHVQHQVLSDPDMRSFLRSGKAIAGGPAGDLLNDGAVIAALMEKEIGDGGTTGVLENLLAALLLKCLHKAGVALDRKDRRSDVASRFVEMVDREFLQRRTVNAYATELAITPGHLNELVKKRLGRSAGTILSDRLLLEAKRLLLHADLSVKEVSFALCMEDPAYFTRMFRKATGFTPVEYRTRIREKYQH
jgi:AraC family transcriptional regulator, transcriptional activator of pobA